MRSIALEERLHELIRLSRLHLLRFGVDRGMKLNDLLRPECVHTRELLAQNLLGVAQRCLFGSRPPS